jgi:putative membrane protein
VYVWPYDGRAPIAATGGAHRDARHRAEVRRMGILLSWFILSLAVWVTAMLLPGFHVRSFGSAIVVAALFGVLNFLLGWLFFVILTVATLGLAWLFAFITRWIINAIMLTIVDRFTDRLTIDGFRWALIGALVMAALGTAGEWLLRSSF